MLQDAYLFEIYTTVNESTDDTRVHRAMSLKTNLTSAELVL